MTDESPPLLVDPNRRGLGHGKTGIFVRGKDGHHWGSYDIAELDRDSFLRFLRSRDDLADHGRAWRESVLLLVFGHEQ